MTEWRLSQQCWIVRTGTREGWDNAKKEKLNDWYKYEHYGEEARNKNDNEGS